jgi:hypothetical protein
MANIADATGFTILAFGQSTFTTEFWIRQGLIQSANPAFSVGLRRIFMLDTKRIRVLHTTTLLHKWYDLLRDEKGLKGV